MIVVTAGDDIDVSASLTADGIAVDLTGATVTAGLVGESSSTLATGTSAVAGTVTDAINGKASFRWGKATTGGIVPGNYLVQIKVVAPGLTATWTASTRVHVLRQVLP